MISCTQSAQCNGQRLSLMDTQASKEFKVQSSYQPIQGTILFYPWLVRERRGADIGTREVDVWQKAREG